MGRLEACPTLKRQRGDARPALLVVAEVVENRLRGLGLFGEDELEILAQRGFDGGDVLVGNADLVGQRTEHALALFQGREGPGPEALVLGVELFEDVEPGLLLGLLADELVEFVPGLLEFLLELAQAIPNRTNPSHLEWHGRRGMVEGYNRRSRSRHVFRP